ncbi:3675_t:CDS:2 [Funneliformis caledonium]|uniref:3675_t:CDS:1 n=1 Tax=Funneliformis caledonium TaxID=1117310 RepID=A0A9N9BS12_9GLOM|nr:3675_t:CDS:2 [Funneliformis caledonium]
MSEHEGNFSLCSLFETFTKELEELEDNKYSNNIDNNNVDSDNVDGENEFLNPYTDLNKRNLSFLHKILKDNDEISGFDSDSYENETELDFKSADNSRDESEEIQFSYNDKFDEIIPTLKQKELIACVWVSAVWTKRRNHKVIV